MMEIPQRGAAATRVLLVEDNPGDADLVELSLDEAEGDAFETEHVARLSDALARVGRSPAPDVVLLDLSLPDAVGFDGLRKLTQAAPDVPVVVLTGGEGTLGAAAIQAGAQDYLVKGSRDAPLLARALRYAIERHQHGARARLLAEERAARAAAEQGRERMSLLALASTAVARSLDDRHALAALARAMVPRFAQWCAIQTRSPDVEGHEWIAAHSDPGELADLERRLGSVPVDEADPCGPAAVAASGLPALHEDVAELSGGSRFASALAGMGVRAAIVVPIALDRELLGVMTFAARGDAPFGPDDLEVADEIGRRAAVAIANCRLYREARLAVTARDEFLSVAAHELRTPLAVLQLKLQQVTVKQGRSACGTCEHAVPADYDGATRQIARLGQLVESLLDVSRIVGGRVKLDPEDVDLRDLARDAIDRFADLARRSRSEVTLRCAAPARGRWDRLAIERVLGNLLSNALKFGAEKPVGVSIESEGSHVVVEVQDHGIGIAPDDVVRIFERFERAVSPRHYGGLGLGLFITRRLVEQHGGTIAVASTPGEGSRFTVRLPRAIAVASGELV